jgi:hypothetical protein
VRCAGVVHEDRLPRVHFAYKGEGVGKCLSAKPAATFASSPVNFHNVVLVNSKTLHKMFSQLARVLSRSLSLSLSLSLALALSLSPSLSLSRGLTS